MVVTQATKDAFLQNEKKHLNVKLIKRTFDKYNEETEEYEPQPPREIIIPEENIVADSMKLTESIIESGNIIISGCIARSLEIEFAMISETIRNDYLLGTDGLLIEVSIQAGNTDIIPLFKGHIDSIDNPQSQDLFIIKAYDDFYEYNNVKVNMENLMSNIEDNIGITYPCTFKTLWKDIFDILFSMYFPTHSNVKLHPYSATLTPDYDSFSFPMDNVMVDYEKVPFEDVDEAYHFRTYLDVDTTAFELISAFCQVNGVMAIIDRNNQLTFRKANTWKDDADAESIEFYKNVYIGNYSKKPSSVVIYNSSQEAVYSESKSRGNNLYTVSGNVVTDLMLEDSSGSGSFLNGISDEIATRKYNISTLGMPYLECGIDKIDFSVYSAITGIDERIYPIFKRELSGIQNLTDTFTYDVDTDYDKMTRSLQRQISDLDSAKPNAKYVTETPTDFENNTIYFVRKS